MGQCSSAVPHGARTAPGRHTCDRPAVGGGEPLHLGLGDLVSRGFGRIAHAQTPSGSWRAQPTTTAVPGASPAGATRAGAPPRLGMPGKNFSCGGACGGMIETTKKLWMLPRGSSFLPSRCRRNRPEPGAHALKAAAPPDQDAPTAFLSRLVRGNREVRPVRPLGRPPRREDGAGRGLSRLFTDTHDLTATSGSAA